MKHILLEYNQLNDPNGRYGTDKTIVKESDLHTELETVLCREIIMLQSERESMRETINRLENEVKTIVEELKILKNEQKVPRENKILPSKDREIQGCEYTTDEEQLESDTGWCTQYNRNKKRKASSSPKENTNNRDFKSKPYSERLEKPPPPIIISDVNKYDILQAGLEKQNINANITIINNKSVKLNLKSQEEYRNVTRQLNEAGNTWYSYENKNTKPIRVMAKGIHPSCDPVGVVADIASKGFRISMATPILSNKDKYPLAMFMLTFEHGEDIKKIFEIEKIKGARVKIEHVKRNKLIPQCKHCQGYGHTQRYCKLQPKCVKCAGDHHTKECTKGEIRTPKCANCQKNHPANYRGCEIAKQKQKEKDNLLRRKTAKEAEQQQNSQQHKRNFGTTAEIREKKATQKVSYTYAQAVGGQSEKDILKKIMEKLEQQEKESKIIKEKLENIERADKNINRAMAQRNPNGQRS